MKNNIIRLVIMLLIFLVFGCEVESPNLEIYHGGKLLNSETSFDFTTESVGVNSVVLSVRNPLEKSVLSIDAISIDSPHFLVRDVQNNLFNFPVQIEPGDLMGVWVEYAPINEGAHEAKLTVKVSLEEVEAVDFIFPLQSEIFTVGIGDGGTGLAFASENKFLSFGPVDIGSTKELSIQIKNISSSLIQVQSAIIGSPFSISSIVFPLELLPGEVIQIPVAFSPVAIGSNTGYYFSSLFLATNNGNRMEIPLDGFANELSGPVLQIEDAKGDSYSSTYNFLDVGIGQEGDPVVFYLSNIGTENLVVSNVELSNKNDFFFGDELSFPRTILPKTSLAISAYYAPSPFSLGVSISELQIESNSSRGSLSILKLVGEALGSNTPRISLSQNGEGYSADSSYIFPTTYVDEKISTTFLVKNIGTSDLSISSINISSSASVFSYENVDGSPVVLPLVLAPGETSSLWISFLSDEINSYTGALEFKSNDKEFSSYGINLRASCSDAKPLLPPTILFTNEGVIQDSFVGEFETVGNPKFSFETTKGSSGTANFNYKLSKDGLEVESKDIIGNTEFELSSGVELLSGSYSLSVTEKNSSGSSSESTFYTFIIARDKPQPPIVSFFENNSFKYVLFNEINWTTDIMPVFKWTPAEGEENSIARYQFSIIDLDSLEEIHSESITRNTVFTKSRDHLFSEGNYQFKISAIDGFSQVSEPCLFNFSLDLTAPVITLEKVPNANDLTLVLPKGTLLSDISMYDPVGEAVDATFGSSEISVDYSELQLGLSGVGFQAYYVAEDLLGNKKVGEARMARPVVIVDFDSMTIDFKKHLLNNEYSSISLLGAPVGTYGQLTYEYTIAAGTNSSEYNLPETINYSRPNFALQLIDGELQEIDTRQITCTARLVKADSTQEDFSKTITASFNHYPNILFKDPSFEAGYGGGAWGFEAKYYINYGNATWGDKWAYTDANGSYFRESNISRDWITSNVHSTDEELVRILKPTSSEYQEPTGGPTPPNGEMYFKIGSASYTSGPTNDILGYQVWTYQKIPIIQGQKYRVTCKVFDTNNFFEGNVGLKIDELTASLGDPNQVGTLNYFSTGYMISDITTSRTTVAGSYNKWQTLTATFVVNNKTECLIGLFKAGEDDSNTGLFPEADSGKNGGSLFYDDFTIEYLFD